jgi:hypothetical protein
LVNFNVVTPSSDKLANFNVVTPSSDKLVDFNVVTPFSDELANFNDVTPSFDKLADFNVVTPSFDKLAYFNDVTPTSAIFEKEPADTLITEILSCHFTLSFSPFCRCCGSNPPIYHATTPLIRQY